jgi:hypothetical protein
MYKVKIDEIRKKINLTTPISLSNQTKEPFQRNPCNIQTDTYPFQFEGKVKCWWHHDFFSKYAYSCIINHSNSYEFEGLFCSEQCSNSYGNSHRLQKVQQCHLTWKKRFYNEFGIKFPKLQEFANHFSIQKSYGGWIETKDFFNDVINTTNPVRGLEIANLSEIYLGKKSRFALFNERNEKDEERKINPLQYSTYYFIKCHLQKYIPLKCSKTILIYAFPILKKNKIIFKTFHSNLPLKRTIKEEEKQQQFPMKKTRRRK